MHLNKKLKFEVLCIKLRTKGFTQKEHCNDSTIELIKAKPVEREERVPAVENGRA